MRILIFSLAYFPFVGGAEVAIKEITDRLPEHEFELITVDLDGRQKKTEKIGNVLVRRLGSGKISKYLYPWQAAACAAEWQRARPYDLVWAMMANQAGMAAAKFKKTFPAVPFLLTLQEGDDFTSLSYATRLLGPRWWRVFERADYCQAISHYLAQWGRKMGFRGEPVVVPNGVDLEKIKSQRAKVKSESQKEKIIITTSRLVEKNGVGDLIESLKYLPENVRLHIVGTGPLEQKLKLKTKSSELEARVKFFGHVEPKGIPDYLAQADIFCRPSLSEGLGISFLEAMGAGLPTIGTAVGGIPDFLIGGPINPEQTGWICRARDPRSVAEQVRFIIDPANQSKVQEIVYRARKLVAEKYNWDAVAREMNQIFQKAKI